MLDGKRFLPLTGIPIRKRARMIAMLAVWLPEPLTVATTIDKSLVIGVAADWNWPSSDVAGLSRFIPDPLSSFPDAPGCGSTPANGPRGADARGASRGG